MVTLLFFVLIFSVVVISHEFGHYLLARLNGIHVLEFFIGMGPTLVSKKIGDTLYSVKLLPLGGACLFEGEDGLALKEGEVSKGSFAQAGVWGRIATVAAGPIFNFLLSFLVALVMIAMLLAIREPIATTILEDSAAYAAGLEDGDRIISLNGERIYLYNEISLYMQLYEAGEITVVYERDGVRDSVTLTPLYSVESGSYLLGISCGEFADTSGLNAIKYAWYEVRYSVKMTYKSLLLLLKGQVSTDEVTGPVGIAVNVVGKTYEETKVYGWETVLLNMLNITLLLSVNLGIMNLLPLPALDGGRLVFLVVELLRGKPVPAKYEGFVHMIGMMLLMALMAFVFFNDLKNIFF